MRAITDAFFQSPENAYVRVGANLTVRQALHQWRATHNEWGDPQESWWLVIDFGEQRFCAIGAHDLREMMLARPNAITLNTRLSSLPEADSDLSPEQPYLNGYIEARIIHRRMHSNIEAANLARHSPGMMVCVVEANALCGIVNQRTPQTADVPGKTLWQILDEDHASQVVR